MTKKLCIVVPYRNRETHLAEFVPAIKKTMEEQNIDYELLVVEQTPDKPFNRAKLLNVGFDYTKGEFDYYCFHDVDMLPVESDYSYCSTPTHLAARVEQFDWKLAYNEYFGGVTIFDRESFKLVNGYSNDYWGWGAEDDDIFRRCLIMKVPLSRKNCSFKSLHHERKIIQNEYDKNLHRLKNFGLSIQDGKIVEGLSTLKYKVVGTCEEIDSTAITVEI